MGAREVGVASKKSGVSEVRRRLRELYHGETPRAVRFQYLILAVDVAIIVFFLATPMLTGRPVFLWLDYTIAVIVAADLAARGLASDDVGRWARRLDVWVDLFVLVTLLAPLWLINLSFLRVLRLWTLTRNDLVWRPLRRRGLAEWQDAMQAVVSLVTFLFVITGFVYTFFAGNTPGIETYIDALYFTVATVTTTGFGDITLEGPWGRLTSVLAMIVGISLFVRLAQAIFRPHKVSFPCPRCALQRHDADAVHCKACGQILRIPDEDE